MSTIAKHHKLLKEDPDFYHVIDTRDQKTFPVAKRNLSLAMHKKFSNIQKFDEGGTTQPTLGTDTSIPQPEALDYSISPSVPAAAPNIVAPKAIPTNIPLTQQAAINQGNLEKGILEQSKAGVQENQENIANVQAHNEAMAKVFQGYQDSRAKLDAEHEALSKAVLNQTIDPNKYFNDMSLPGKISTGIAVVLGGIGAGLQHSNVNQALGVVQNAIQRDIEAQKANLGKKQSLLSMNMEKYRNLDAATAATSAQMNAMFEGQLRLAAAKSGNLKQQAAADQAIAENRAKNIQAIPGLAEQQFRMDAINGLNGTPSVPSAAERLLTPTAPRQPNASNQTPQVGLQATGAIEKQPEQAIPGITPDQIDIKKLNALKLSGLLKGEDATEVQKQISGVVENHAAKQQIKNEFDRMERAIQLSGVGMGSGIDLARTKQVAEQLPIIGGMIAEQSPWGGQQGRLFDASRKGALNTVNRILTKRIGGEAMKNIKAGLPTGEESPEERQEQLQRIYDIIDKSSDTSALQQNRLLKKR